MDDEALSRRDFGKRLGAAALAAGVHDLTRITDAAHSTNPSHTPSPAMPDESARAASAPGDELCAMTAIELAARIRRKDVSAREVMEAHLARIARVNPKVNAIVTLVPDQAMAWAREADEKQARGETLGVLHGLPVAHKDLVDTAGIRTTRGSLLFKDNIPTTDALIVKRTRAAGAITLGKTNTPEFGAGSNTFNAVFGPTRNGYDLTRTVGGSSGGAACALTCELVPIAGGSDTGGSLRNPASWNNVVGFRPSPGRVTDDDNSWSPLSTGGPMARTVADVALFLSTISGYHAPDPLALTDDPAIFRAPLERSMKGVRIAWFTSLGGIPFEPEITRVVNAQRQVFVDLGCIVEEAEPAFDGVDEAFPILRHLSYHASYARLARENPTLFKDTVKWEIAEAERLRSSDVARALSRQQRMYREVSEFFTKHDFFVCPVTQVEPFDIGTEYPTRVNGVPMPTYIDWMRSCWYVTFMATPAISVPAGFTARGLPVGLQLVGKPRDDWGVLQAAHAFEQATRHGKKRPAL